MTGLVSLIFLTLFGSLVLTREAKYFVRWQLGMGLICILRPIIVSPWTYPPVVDKFQGEVDSSDNSINLECQVRDLESGLQSNKISWTVNGKPGGSLSFPERIHILYSRSAVERQGCSYFEAIDNPE